MGQLERLISRREHGLELYAGGKGHGEPPGIDWAHDYVDRGGFQKLRMRNWAACPNFEVETGPLAVRVRRWGFPHSPVHPVFTPSRLHIDQTYTFYAGLPYFLKEGRMDAIQAVDVEAMRDDEWVFSGYSFNETLWIDRAGKLREGPVPASEAEDLRGVGFRHRDSRDAFLALWLEHHADGLAAIGHNGAPTLHYPGHGQLWSRYPLHHARLEPGVSLRQKNAYVILAYEDGTARRIEELRHRLLHPVEIMADQPRRGEPARASGALARTGEIGDTTSIKAAIWRALRRVRDEQLYTADANIVDLGLVYDVRWRHGTAQVVMTMPHRGRPVHDFFVSRGGGRVDAGIRERLLEIDGVRDVVVDLTWDPPWTPARLTDAGRRALGLDGS
jgi:metal-sulfur cluster biosynthetic enzyme